MQCSKRSLRVGRSIFISILLVVLLAYYSGAFQASGGGYEVRRSTLGIIGAEQSGGSYVSRSSSTAYQPGALAEGTSTEANIGFFEPIDAFFCTINADCPTDYFCNTNGMCQAELIDGQTCKGTTFEGTGLSEDQACQSGHCDNDGVGAADDGWCFSPVSLKYDNQDNKCEESTNSALNDNSDEYRAECRDTSGYVADDCIFYTDGDSNSQTCTCTKGTGYWSIGGEVSSTTCCDDASEYKRTRLVSGTMDNGYSNSTADDACCNANTKCVNNSVCYATGYVSGDADGDGDTDYCNAGLWYDCLDDSNCDTANGFYCNGGDCTEKCEVPASGTWTISDNQVCRNMNLNYSGAINIVSGGSLTLHNVNLTLNYETAGRYALTVNSGAKLYLNKTNVSEWANSNYYYVRNYGELEAYSSDLRTATSPDRVYLYLYSGSVSSIEDSDTFAVYTYAPSAKANITNTTMYRLHNFVGSDSVVTINGLDQDDSDIDYDIVSSTGSYNISMVDCDFTTTSGLYFSNDGGTLSISNSNIYFLVHHNDANDDTTVSSSYVDEVYYYNYGNSQNITLEDINPPYASGYSKTISASNGNDLTLSNVGIARFIYFGYGSNTEVHVNNCTFYHFYTYTYAKSYVNNSRITGYLYNYGTASKSYFTNVNATNRAYLQGTSYLDCKNCNFSSSVYTLVSDTATVNLTSASYINKYYQYSSNPKIYGFVNFTNFYSWRAGTIDREIPFNLTYYGGSPASGKNITIKSGATTVDSGITDANGMVYLEILDAPSQSATWDVYVEGSNLDSITIFENSAPYGVELQINCTKNADCGAGYYCNSSYQCSDTLANGVACVGATAVANNTEQDGACTSGYCDNDGVGLADDGWCFSPYSTYYDGQENTKCEKSATSVVSDASDEKTGNACDGTSGWINSACYYFSDGDLNSETCVCVSGVDMYYSGGSGQLKCCGDDGGSDNFCAGGSWYCNAGTKTADGDVSSSACSCLGYDWLIGGIGTNSDCCGDDGSAEYFEQSESAGSSCCYNGTVLTNGSSSGAVLCYNGQLYDCANQVTLGIETEVSNCNQASTSGMYCDATGVPTYWQSGIPIGCGGCQQNSECSGGGGTPLCDAENGAVEPLYGLVSDDNLCFACDVCGAGAFRCSSENGLCQYDCAASEDCDDTAPDYCVDNTGESNDQYYCDAGCVVRDRDYGETVCEKSNNDCVAYDWATGGEVSSFGGYDTGSATECCGDDSDEYLRNTSLSGSYYSACCNAITDCVNATSKCIASGTEQGGYYCINGVWNTLPTHDTPYTGSHRINTTDLIGYWTLDNDAKDSSGNANHGTVYGNASNTREGRVGGAYEFDGNGDYVAVQDSPVLDMAGSNTFTIGTWVYPEERTSNRAMIINKEESYETAITPSGEFQWALYTNSRAWYWQGTGVNIPLDTWTHITWVYDGNYVKTFMNGQEKHSYSYSGSLLDRSSNFIIGWRGSQADSPFNGSVDEVAIYNRSLNSTEVAELYNMTYKTYTQNDLACAPNASSDSDGDNMTYIFNWYKDDSSVMVLNMPFDNNVSSTSSGAVRDYSPNENNGTLGGGTSSYVPTYTTGSDCISGGCYEFDGVNDYIRLPTNGFDITKGSYEVWFKPAKLPFPTWSTLIHHENASVNRNTIVLTGVSGQSILTFAISNSSGNPLAGSWTATTTPALTEGVWYHVVGTWDQSAGIAKIYLNGTLRDTSSGTQFPTQKATYFGIGKNLVYDNRQINGTLDEVKVYNYVLTPEQVYANYIAGLNAHQPDVIAWNQTTKGEEWKCSVTVSDGIWDSDTKNSSSITIQNSPPSVPALTNPAHNNNTITNRTPVFNWSASTDPDGDSITYTINIDRTGCPYPDYCNGTDPINQALISNLYFTPSSNLDLSPYDWKVRSCDSWICSDWSSTRNFTIIPYVAIDLIHSTTDFGTLSIDETKNTTASAPGQTNGPLLVRNSGNCFVNITVNATNPYSSASTNTEYFKFLASTYSGEPGSFNASCSQTTWMNMSTTQKNSICGLNFADSTDEARLDLLITIPPAEPTGTKSSTVMLTAEMD